MEDLHNCLPLTNLRPVLIKKLQKALETRLLHPGVSTPDILTAYVAAIRSLRELDPSGVLLDLATQPIHQYLRSREDTVRFVLLYFGINRWKHYFIFLDVLWGV